MADVVELVKAMKRAALEAIEASKPVNVYFGQVIADAPLQINVEQKMILGNSQLILSRNVTDHKTMVSVQWETEKEITIHNALEVGDEVILIRQQEGQKYIVIDRIGVM